MQINSVSKRILASFLSLQILFAGAPMAFAEEGTGSSDIFTADGLTYKVLSETEDGNGTVQVGNGTSSIAISGSVEVPETVTNGDKTYDVVEIGDKAFLRQESLTEVTLPDSVTSIGVRAFFGTGLESFEMSDSVTSIGEDSFGASEALASITLSENLEVIPAGAFGSCSALRQIDIPEGVTSIESSAFLSCQELQRVSLPASLETIGDKAFWQDEALNTLTIAEDSQLTSIGESAFQWCALLKSVKLPVGLKEIGKSAFANCESLDDIGLDSTTGSELETLGDGSFNATKLTSFYFPDTLTNLGERPLSSCSKLASIIVDENNPSYQSMDGILFSKDGSELLMYPAAKKGSSYKVPAGVTSIAKYAFWGNSRLSELTMSDGVETLGDFVFQNASSLTSVTIADSVTKIGRLGFYNNPKLEIVHLSENLEVLVNSAFYNCEFLEEITIPKNVTEIQANAFGSCPNLETITILSDKLTTVEAKAFAGAADGVKISVPNLAVKALVVASGIPESQVTAESNDPGTDPGTDPEPEVTSFTAGGWEYTVLTQASGEKNGTVQLGNGKSSVSASSTVVIPETVSYEDKNYTVTAIGAHAFEADPEMGSSIKTVTLPASVVSIGDKAFYDCYSITSFTIPEGSQLASIGNNAFDSCSGITSLKLPSTLRTIGSEAFLNCSKLSDCILPEGLTSLGDGAFTRATKLTSVTIPSTLTTLGDRPFDSCTGLKEMNVTAGNSAYSSENGVLFNANKTELMLYPAQKAGDSYTVPQTVKAISAYAFAQNANLYEVDLSGVETIGVAAFSKCSKLETVNLGSKLVSIDRLAFQGCSSLEEIRLPASLKALADNLFSGASSLGKIEILSAQLETVAKNAFSGVSASANYSVPNERIKGLLTESGVKEAQIQVVDTGEPEPEVTDFTIGQIQYDVLSQSTGTENGSVRISNAKNTTGKVTLSSTVEYLGKVYDVISIGDSAFSGSSMTEIVLPESIVSIGDLAFTKCNGLTGFVIPSGVKSIGARGITECEKLKTITFAPNSSLESLGNGSLGDNPVLESVRLPKTLKNIGTHLMLFDSSLKTVEFEQGSQWTSLPDGTFMRCPSLETVLLPESVTEIGSEAFYDCQSLKAFGGLTAISEIGENAFYNCLSLTEITLSDDLEELGSGVFSGCTGLKSVQLGNGLATLGAMVAEDAEESVVGVFEGCTSLTEIIVPASVKTIGKSVFKNCTSLSRIEIKSNTLKPIGSNAFYNLAPNAQIIVENEAVKNTLIQTALVPADKIVVKAPQPGNDFKAVTGIINLPAQATAGVALTLTGTVVPADATNRTIKWQLADADNQIGASITGNRFTAKTAGTVTVRAIVENGLADSESYVQEFQLTVKAAENPGNNGNGSGNSGSGSSSNKSSKNTSSSSKDTAVESVVTSPSSNGGTVTTVTTVPSSDMVTNGAAQISAAVPESVATALASATAFTPSEVKISVPTASLVQQLKNTEVTKVSLNLAVPASVANNTNANAQVSVQADGGLLNTARLTGKDLEIAVQNAQTGKTAYTWSFNGSALAQATMIRDLNLALSVHSTSEVPAVQSAAPSSTGLVLRFAENGQLPAAATVTVDVAAQGYQPGQILYFYYLNPANGSLELQNNGNSITVNEQGYAAVTVTHNSDFVLLPNKAASDSLTLDTLSYNLPQGKSYEIGAKLTAADATLKVTSSRAGLVKIERTNNGNYKVTGLKSGTTYVSFDVYSGNKLVAHSSVKVTVQNTNQAQGVSAKRVVNF